MPLGGRSPQPHVFATGILLHRFGEGWARRRFDEGWGLDWAGEGTKHHVGNQHDVGALADGHAQF